MPKKISPTARTASKTSVLLDDGPLPKLIAFDLDYTLWPFWVDTHVTPPLRSTGNPNAVHDRHRDVWSFYSDIPSLLQSISAAGIPIAACSRTHAPELAREMLSLLTFDVDGTRKRSVEYFSEFEIYPGSKVTHFKRLQEKTGVEFDDMLFFDDESRNRNVERELGVMMVLVPKGVSQDVFERGVRKWRERQGKSKQEQQEEDGRIDEV